MTNTDTDRLDWLEKNVFTLINDGGEWPIFLRAQKVAHIRRTVRKAIDEAIRRGSK